MLNEGAVLVRHPNLFSCSRCSLWPPRFVAHFLLPLTHTAHTQFEVFGLNFYTADTKAKPLDGKGEISVAVVSTLNTQPCAWNLDS